MLATLPCIGCNMCMEHAAFPTHYCCFLCEDVALFAVFPPPLFLCIKTSGFVNRTRADSFHLIYSTCARPKSCTEKYFIGIKTLGMWLTKQNQKEKLIVYVLRRLCISAHAQWELRSLKIALQIVGCPHFYFVLQGVGFKRTTLRFR